MPETNLIDVEVYPADEAALEPLAFEDVNYISFVSSPGGQTDGTYGIPALLGGATKVSRDEYPVTILYVNPANITCMKAIRKD
jgi:hypothetical protein